MSREQFLELNKAIDTAPKLKGGTFNPTGALELVGRGKLDNLENEFQLNVRTWARNGTFYQTTTLKKDKHGNWTVSKYKIVRENNNPASESEVLLEEDYK